MPSDKTAVIEHIFRQRWDSQRRVLTNALVSQVDVQNAIIYCNAQFNTNLSIRNPANFMKDIVRGQGASKNWPDFLKQLRFTAIQRSGDTSVFEFVPYGPGQTEPFPDLYKPTATTQRYSVQSISLPLAAKTLGRSDEPWLIQTAVNLRVIETHLAVASDVEMLELSHLQMSVKLRETEIDALFLALCEIGGEQVKAIVTCEAKQARERILEHQIIAQTKAAFEETTVDWVIPIGLRAIRRVGFYVVEFEIVSKAAAASLSQLTVATEAVYELKPPVPGI